MNLKSIVLSVTAFGLISANVYGIKDSIGIAKADSAKHVFYVNPENKSGYITMDKNGNIVSASSKELSGNNQKIQTSSVENNGYGRWVYYSDGWGNSRTGYSNFYSTLGKHFSWVSMGGQTRRYGEAYSGSYSYASQRGGGQFQAGYGVY